MTLSERENYLQAMRFEHPSWTPVSLGFAPATWKRYRERLEKVVLDHQGVFPGYVKGSIDFDDAGSLMAKLEPDGPRFRSEGDTYQDSWGCLWLCGHDGLGGQPIGHPLADWSALDSYHPPDILRVNRWGEDREDWDNLKRRLDENRKKGILAAARIPCFFDRLHYLRGFENLLCDFADDPPELHRLIDMILEANLKLIGMLLELGLDVVDHHGDIGTQRGLMISPATFRKYLKPGYSAMFAPFREAGIPVRYSSDGNLLRIIDDLIECGVSSHDPQLTVNGLDEIANAYKGRLCALVDFGQELALMTPHAICQSIREVVAQLGAPEGGLILRGFAIPDVPLENIEAFCLAAEEFCLKSNDCLTSY